MAIDLNPYDSSMGIEPLLYFPQAGEPAAGGQCTRTGVRRAAGGLVPPGTDVAAVRISAPGWENAVLDGLQVPCSCWIAYADQSTAYP